MSTSDEKSRLRHEIKSSRAQMGAAERNRASQALAQRLFPFLRAHRVENIAVYLASPGEISLDPLIQILLAEGVGVSAPRIDLESNTMAFFHLPSLAEVRTGPYNLREPLSDVEVVPSWVLVPGLAFDLQGHRLGMGAGWYDRTLTPGMTTVGICYDWQIIPHVPLEDHDKPMSWVFSDARQLGAF